VSPPLQVLARRRRSALGEKRRRAPPLVQRPQAKVVLAELAPQLATCGFEQFLQCRVLQARGLGTFQATDESPESQMRTVGDRGQSQRLQSAPRPGDRCLRSAGGRVPAWAAAAK